MITSMMNISDASIVSFMYLLQMKQNFTWCLNFQEVEAKRQESMGGYSDTMGELSTLLETQSGQNNKLLSENTELSQHMSQLLEEAQNREKQFETIQTELTLQLKLRLTRPLQLN